jgi:hypothetical protein
MPKKNKHEDQEINQEYNEIVDHLIEMIGGKEYCLRQLLFEQDHRDFVTKYRDKNREAILEKISKFYESTPYDKENIVNIEISSGAWNKHMLKVFFYDEKYHRVFEFLIKTNKVEEVSLFEYDEFDEGKNYTRSFYSKLRGGNLLWDKYNKELESKNSEEQLDKLKKERDYFVEKMKHFKFIPDDELGDIELEEAPEQYTDGKTRYLYNNHFYYRLVGITGYITFSEKKDIMMESIFSKYFYEKIVSKLRQ